MLMKRRILGGVILLGMVAAGWSQTVPMPYGNSPVSGTVPTPGKDLTQVPGLGGLPQPGGGVSTSVTPNTVTQPMRPTQNVSKPLPPLNPYPQPTLQAPTGRVQYGQHNPSASTQKPFANYQKPSNFSPYMNLYRRDNFSGVDNYNFYVKPALEAEQQKAEMQREIHDLQRQQQQQQTATPSATQPGAVYGRLNSGAGASYGFPGRSGLPSTPAVATEKTPKEEEQEKEEEEKKEERGSLHINPYNPYLPPGVGPQKVRTIP
ncbi:MAG: hypothetical protein Q4D62_14450 [Planctomycetia bacterium]|nr:hypothetical protein [Planctomycetia bacterium]